MHLTFLPTSNTIKSKGITFLEYGVMHITSKGQVTIPQHIREQFGLLPKSEVQFQIENNKVYLIKMIAKDNPRGKYLIQTMKGQGNVTLSTDEIMALTRE